MGINCTVDGSFVQEMCNSLLQKTRDKTIHTKSMLFLEPEVGQKGEGGVQKVIKRKGKRDNINQNLCKLVFDVQQRTRAAVDDIRWYLTTLIALLICRQQNSPSVGYQYQLDFLVSS